MRSNRIWCMALFGLFVAGSSISVAVAQQAATAPPPEPVAVIRQMCDYLKSLQQFSFRSEVTYDQSDNGGSKLQYGLDMETYVRRPNSLRVNAEGDLVNKELFFNGNTVSLYDKTAKVYGSIKVPPSIEGALDKARKDFGLVVALTDLADPLLWEHISKGLERSIYLGLHKVRGVSCHHLAFDKADVSFQVWVDAGEKPLPRKITFTMKKLGSSPQWMGYISD